MKNKELSTQRKRAYSLFPVLSVPVRNKQMRCAPSGAQPVKKERRNEPEKNKAPPGPGYFRTAG